jgi:hypothetical protein
VALTIHVNSVKRLICRVYISTSLLPVHGEVLNSEHEKLYLIHIFNNIGVFMEPRYLSRYSDWLRVR